MNTAAGGYDPAFYDSLLKVEDEHFWFLSRNRLIAAMASEAVAGLAPGYRVLEVGCGTGNVTRFLQAACPGGVTVGIDLYGEGLPHARKRGVTELVRADISQAPFRDKFHLIGMFDVLEHIEDDGGVLKQLLDLLEEGGTLLLTVPAHRALWSYFDEASHHCRRYAPRQLRQRLVDAGYTIQFLSQYMMPLYPLVWASRRLAARRGGEARELARDEFRVNRIVNSVLTALLRVERFWLTRGWRLPMGTSLIAVASRADFQVRAGPPGPASDV